MNTLGDITVQRITTNVGAVVGGLDLRVPLADDILARLRQLLVDHGAIFFHDQDLNRDQFWSLMENFGIPLKDESTGTEKNTSADLAGGDFRKSRFGTAIWHSDTTSLAKPPIATALRAVEVPPFGGDTCWSSMYAAWEALSEPMKAMLDGLHSVHTVDFTIERMRELGDAFDKSYSARNARQQIHPVVITHPETGRKALYVNESFSSRIVELDRLESRSMLDFLFRHIERPDFTMRWKWTANDLSIWDNRCVQHYAVPDYDSTRQMERVVLAGEKPGEHSKLQPRADKRQVENA